MIHVVAGAVTDATGRVLIAQRPPGKHLAGGWEFPGGKLEPGEARVAGLARELREELGISICAPRPLLRLRHTYDFGEVLIDMWVVTQYAGVPRGLDGQCLQWVTLEELAAVELLPADAPIVRALRLPAQLHQSGTRDYRIYDLATLLGGLHADLDSGSAGETKLRGALCFTVEDARAGAAGGADFLVVSADLPRQELRALCAELDIPVYVRAVSLESAWNMGASGTVPLL